MSGGGLFWKDDSMDSKANQVPVEPCCILAAQKPRGMSLIIEEYKVGPYKLNKEGLRWNSTTQMHLQVL